MFLLSPTAEQYRFDEMQERISELEKCLAIYAEKKNWIVFQRDRHHSPIVMWGGPTELQAWVPAKKILEK